MKYFETEKIELKEKINDQLIKDIESFLNTEGGTIFLGIRDNGDVVGVDSLDESLRKISDIISDQIDPNAIDCVKPEVFIEENNALIKLNINKGYASLYCIAELSDEHNPDFQNTYHQEIVPNLIKLLNESKCLRVQLEICDALDLFVEHMTEDNATKYMQSSLDTLFNIFIIFVIP